MLHHGVWLRASTEAWCAFLSYICSRNNSVLSFSVSSMYLPGSAPRYPQINHAQAAFSNEDLHRSTNQSGVSATVLWYSRVSQPGLCACVCLLQLYMWIHTTYVYSLVYSITVLPEGILQTPWGGDSWDHSPARIWTSTQTGSTSRRGCRWRDSQKIKLKNMWTVITGITQSNTVGVECRCVIENWSGADWIK